MSTSRPAAPTFPRRTIRPAADEDIDPIDTIPTRTPRSPQSSSEDRVMPEPTREDDDADNSVDTFENIAGDIEDEPREASAITERRFTTQLNNRVSAETIENVNLIIERESAASGRRVLQTQVVERAIEEYAKRYRR